MNFSNNTSTERNIACVVLIPVFLCVSVVCLLVLISCASQSLGTDKRTTPLTNTKSISPSEETRHVKTTTVSLSKKDATTFPLRPSMMTDIYKKITKKISAGEYDVALNELDQFISRHTTPQIYVVEAHLLRLILISGYRAAYLQLADVYHLGWEEVHKAHDGKLPVEERIGRLANLSKASLEYFQKHKEMVVKLINAYEEIKNLYPIIKSDRLQIIADPLKVVKDKRNTLLEQVKKGIWLETADRLKAEKNEINSRILGSWTKLMGVKDVHRANRLLGHGPYALNKSDFFTWLGGSMIHQVDSARPEAFKDEPELVHILKNKSTECLNLAK